MERTGQDYPCGPCELPLICSECGEIITEENVIESKCDEGENFETCEYCEYCGIGKCPKCKSHWHCGGCV